MLLLLIPLPAPPPVSCSAPVPVAPPPKPYPHGATPVASGDECGLHHGAVSDHDSIQVVVPAGRDHPQVRPHNPLSQRRKGQLGQLGQLCATTRTHTRSRLPQRRRHPIRASLPSPTPPLDPHIAPIPNAATRYALPFSRSCTTGHKSFAPNPFALFSPLARLPPHPPLSSRSPTPASAGPTSMTAPHSCRWVGASLW